MLASARIRNFSSIALQECGPGHTLLWTGLLSEGKCKNFHVHFDMLTIHTLKTLTNDNIAKQNTGIDVDSPKMEVECGSFKKRHW